MTSRDKGLDEVFHEFREVVDLTPKQLQEWLDTDESQSVGWTGSGGGGRRDSHRAPAAHEARRPRDDDYAERRRVVGYVHRHLAQRPTKEDIKTSRWRYSLRNWGHDPLSD